MEKNLMSTSVKTTAPKIEDRPEQPYVGIRTRAAIHELGQVIQDLTGEVFQWMKAQGIKPAGGPIVRYHVINMGEGLDVEMGVPVAQAVKGNERVKAAVLPAGRYASLVYTGVMNGMEGNRVLIDWAKEKGLTWDRWDDPNGDAFASRYETELIGPDQEPDAAKWDIEVAIKLAD
jgi:effector-binding domain-containing protein